MSNDPPSVAGAGPSSSPAKIMPLKKRRGCGCLGTVSGAIVFVLAITLLLNPWALHMGGRWTPALTWHGVGKLQSTSGATYGLFVEVSVYLASGRRGTGGGRNLQGTAKLCTLQGEIYPLTVSGYLKRAWLDADRKPVTFYFRSLQGADTKLNFELLGSWQGQELVLEDRGNMAMSFAPDGRAKGYLKGSNSPKEDTAGTIHYATENEFSAACSARNGNSF
jgi:hypothetical protein